MSSSSSVPPTTKGGGATIAADEEEEKSERQQQHQRRQRSSSSSGVGTVVGGGGQDHRHRHRQQPQPPSPPPPKFPRNHANDLLLKLLNGESCALGVSEDYVHSCTSNNGQLFEEMMRFQGETIGEGAHGKVVALTGPASLADRIGGAMALKLCIEPTRDLQRLLRSEGSQMYLPQFVAEMIHAALLAALVETGTSPHFLRAGPFVTKGNSCAYAMERIDTDLNSLEARALDAAAAQSVFVAVLHSIMLYQESFGMTHNDLKPSNIFVAPIPAGDKLAAADWFAYELGDGTAVYCRNPGFLVKIADPGVGVSSQVHIAGFRQILQWPLGPSDIVRNRRVIRGTLRQGQRVRVVRDGASVMDGTVEGHDPSGRVLVRKCSSFSGAGADVGEPPVRSAGSSVGTAGTIASAGVNSPAPPDAHGGGREVHAFNVGDQPGQCTLLELFPAYEAFGVHGNFQAGYDLHFFVIHFCSILRAIHGVDPASVPVIRAVLGLHNFASSEHDARVPPRVQKTRRPRHDDVFPLTARQVLTHPEVAKVIGPPPPSSSSPSRSGGIGGGGDPPTVVRVAKSRVERQYGRAP